MIETAPILRLKTCSGLTRFFCVNFSVLRDGLRNWFVILCFYRMRWLTLTLPPRPPPSSKTPTSSKGEVTVLPKAVDRKFYRNRKQLAKSLLYKPRRKRIRQKRVNMLPSLNILWFHVHIFVMTRMYIYL
jgi:hypothetical protein